MIVIGDAPLGRGCALACAPCSSAGPAAASAAPVRRTLRRSISLSSAVGWLTISPSMEHRSHALRSLKIEAWLWPPVKETGPRRCRRAILLAPTDGTASDHEGCKKPKGIPINESALRDVEAAAIGQQVLVFEAATGRGIDEAFDRRLGGTLRGSAELFGTRFCRSRRADELRDQLCRYVSSSRALCCRPPQGRQAHGPAGYAGHEVRAGDQPQYHASGPASMCRATRLLLADRCSIQRV